jgi:N12 class adenine-specific DNA methylase
MAASKAQLGVLKKIADGGTLYMLRQFKTSFTILRGVTQKVNKKTFDALYNRRYIDTNGHNIEGRDYYQLSEKGIQAVNEYGKVSK